MRSSIRTGKEKENKMEQKKNNMATASMVIGILSIVLSCCCFMGFGMGALAIVFAQLSKVEERLEGKAKAGLITGIIGIVLGLVSLIVWIGIMNADYSSAGMDIYGFLVKGGLL